MEQIKITLQDVSELLKNGRTFLYLDKSEYLLYIDYNETSIYNNSGPLTFVNFPYILTRDDLCKLFQFGNSKMDKILNANILPVVQIGKDYRITQKQLDEWFKKNGGKRILL